MLSSKILILHDDLLNLFHSNTKALSLTKEKKKKKLLASFLFSTHYSHKCFRHTDLRPKDFGFSGQRWAMISGTSMATPHVVGLAVLLKEKYPLWNPAALASAMVTTADVQDSRGVPLQAQEVSGGSTPLLQNATPFDMGGGALDVNVALNLGIIFDAS